MAAGGDPQSVYTNQLVRAEYLEMLTGTDSPSALSPSALAPSTAATWRSPLRAQGPFIRLPSRQHFVFFAPLAAALAQMYRTHDRIAGFEVLSEPRSKDVPSLRKLNVRVPTEMC